MRTTYQSLLVRQRSNRTAPTFCVFLAPAGELLQWVEIERLKDKPGAPQRIEKPAKTRAIARFLERDVRNTIPNSILITMKLPATQEREIKRASKFASASMYTLSIESSTTRGLVIDGQHRLLGARRFNAKTPLIVVGLVGADDLETAFQFLVVNHKAARVATDHIRALTLEYSDAALAERLKTARFALSRQAGLLAAVDDDAESPFQSSLQWPRNRTGTDLVLPAAVETSLAYICAIAPALESEEDLLLEFFFALWRSIKDAWPQLWNSKSKLLKKVGLVTTTQYFSDLLVNLSDAGELDLADPAAIEERMRRLIEAQRPEFWTKDWSESGLDTTAGRRIVVESLKTVARNTRAGRDWDTDVALVSGVENSQNI